MFKSISGIIVAAIGIAALVIVLGPLLGTLLGAFTGWVVGWFFSETILGFFALLGISAKGLAMWHIGASLGFIGGFFKSYHVGNKSSK